MNRTIVSLCILLTSSVFASDQKAISRSEYIENWKSVAIEQMLNHNIPASITLAQGILESGSGNSVLAREGNNHFGIKCHGWNGKKIYLDDDAKGECFRVYKNANASYDDHSAFLMKYERYDFLFTYESTDYKSWAKGLKTAGYATNPKYPKLLMDIIEDLGLEKYDLMTQPLIIAGPELIASEKENNINHSVLIHSNRVKYIVAKNGDTFYKVSKEFDLTLSQLYRYNSFNKRKDVLEVGDIIYIQPKRRGSLFKKKETILKEDLSLNAISQYYAINVSSLKRLNNFSDDTVVSKGEKVTLR